MQQGVVYQISCSLCKAEAKKTYYYGESARTGYDRGLEHLAALGRMNPESPLVEHLLEAHPGVGVEDDEDTSAHFQMSIVSTHPKPLQRQCQEAHLIQTFREGQLMNRKGEWGQNLPPKLTLADEDLEKPGPIGKRKRGARMPQQDLQQEIETPQQPGETQRPYKRPRPNQDEPKSNHLKGKDILEYFRKPQQERRILEGKDTLGSNLHGGEQREAQIVERDGNMTHQSDLMQTRTVPEKVLEELGSPGLGEINLKQ